MQMRIAIQELVNRVGIFNSVWLFVKCIFLRHMLAVLYGFEDYSKMLCGFSKLVVV